MKNQHDQFLLQNEFETFQDFLQHQVDTMRICQESMDEMISDQENIDIALKALERIQQSLHR